MSLRTGRSHRAVAAVAVLAVTLALTACDGPATPTRPAAARGPSDLPEPAAAMGRGAVETAAGPFVAYDLPESFESFRHVTGSVQIRIAGDEFHVSATLTGLEPDMPEDFPLPGHMMHVHEGHACGTFGDFRFGAVRIWLDRDLETPGPQELHQARDHSGQVTVRGSAPLDAVLANGGFADLDGLDLKNRVVVVHGTAAKFAIPVACAELR